MGLLRPLAACATLAIVATTSGAQSSGRVRFQSTRPVPSVTALGYYVGPFHGTLLSDPTRPTIDLYCVDVLNSVTWGREWNANFTRLTSNNLGNTRHGNGARDNYIKAAWLAGQYRAPGIQSNQWGGIQSAIWELLNPGYPNGGTTISANTTEAFWLGQVNTWYSNPVNVASFDMRRWTIVTDVGAAGLRQGGGTQEFLTTGVTPEPETWMLMGTGMVLLVGFAIKRRIV